MTDDRGPTMNLAELWSTIVATVTAKAALTPRQRAFLSLVQPVVFIRGFAVLSVNSTETRAFIERELADHIAQTIYEVTGEQHVLSITVAPQAEPAPPVAPTPPPTKPPALFPEQEPWSPAHVNSAEDSAPEEDTAPAYPPVTPPAGKASATVPTAARQQHPENVTPAGATPRPPHPARRPRETSAVRDTADESALNPDYTFESFVVGSNNRYASGAAVAVAETPAHAYNPLFISGGSGLGKTHLLHAIGNYAKELQPSLRIRYVSSEEFTNDYINSVRDDRQESFKRRYRNLDILMVDDIQFLQGKEGTQEEFFHTFNALHQANKQIILSSDRPPDELVTLEDRLRTRFKGGLITDIQPPDLETRIAILMKKAEAENIQVPHEVYELIASQFDASIRELNGGLLRVTAYASIYNLPINLSTAEAAISELIPDREAILITPAMIIEAASEFFNIDSDLIIGTRKTRDVAHARQVAMYLCRELTELSLPKIGEAFGGKDHSTVLYAERKITKEMNSKRETYDEIQQLTKKIKHG